jgi:DNA ligase-associated metallophosphoesterase
MRAALKTVEQVECGESLPVSFAGCDVLLDPAGAAMFIDQRMLVVSDLHLEKGSSFARRGVFLPPYDTAATLARLTAMIVKYQPRIVVSLGDTFHDDGGSERLGRDALATIGAIATGREMIWVTGNHDPSPPVSIPGDSVSMFAFGRIAFRHIPDGTDKGYEVSGHLHPCARLARKGRSVRRACFASDGTRMIMPSFGVFTGGLNVCDEAYAGLFDAKRFRAFMLGADKVYPIGARDLCGD